MVRKREPKGSCLKKIGFNLVSLTQERSTLIGDGILSGQ